MRKTFTIMLAVCALVAFAVAPVMAGENCSSKKADKADKIEAKLTGSTAACGSKSAAVCDKTSGTHASAKMCMTKAGMTEEECKTLCSTLGEGQEIRAFTVAGMTCGSCENAVTTALGKIEGVSKVAKVSYKDGVAIVVVEKAKAKDAMLTKAIADKGFKAQVMNAAATTAAAPAGDKAACSTKDKEACAKACADKKAAEEKKATDETL